MSENTIEDLFEPVVSLRTSFSLFGATLSLNVEASGFPQYFHNKIEHLDDDGEMNILDTTLSCIEFNIDITDPMEIYNIYMDKYEGVCIDVNNNPASQLNNIFSWIHNWYKIGINNPNEIQLLSNVPISEELNIWSIIDTKVYNEGNQIGRLIYASQNGEEFIKILDIEEESLTK